MITRYKLYLYKLFTTPNNEGVESQVLSTFWTMILLQTANVASLFLLIRFFFPVVNLENVNNVILFLIFTFPSIILNYSCIYYKKEYKKILREYSHIKKGSLMYLIAYFLATMIAWLVIGLLQI